jgi:hypothetical protein
MTSITTGAQPRVETRVLATKADGSDPTAGRIHVFGKPVSKLALFGIGAAGAVAGGGLAYGISRMSSAALSTPKLGLIAAGGALLGGLTGAALSAFSDGPEVGVSVGRRSVFVKTGEEAYNTTCTETFRTNVGDTDGDGFANYHTTTRTYPCVKIRDVGYNEWRAASGELNLGFHKGASDGYGSLEEAKAAVTDADTLFVQRDGGRIHAYGIDTDGPQKKDSIRVTSPGVFQ